jgi:hypothetical protein
MTIRATMARCCVLACAVLVLGATVNRITPAADAAAMARAANSFLAALDAPRRDSAQFDFTDDERMNWHFVPRARRGIAFKTMTQPQRDLARALLQTGLSQRGYLKANTIIELELVLRELGGSPTQRDPEQYFFSIFGTPGSGMWGWRFEGHHLSLNFTVSDQGIVATAPAFFGANPAEVRTGSRVGLRALAAEEDLARALITALDAQQRATAIIAAAAPNDIVTMNRPRVDPLSPAGISVARLNPAQTAQLRRLIDEYLSRMADDIAAQRRASLERSDFSQITFAWAGSIERGQPHYYRIQGPSFLIEYDNTQNNANHIHSVWRDFAGDFGRDLIREHYESADHHGRQ